MPVNWLLSAVGRAYLGFCPEHERKKVIGLLRKSDHRENWLARDQKRLDEILSETRKRGYGLRDPSFVGGPYGTQAPDGLAGIAVPLRDRSRVHGVINIIWPRAARSIDDMVRDCLPDLRTAAEEIVTELRGARVRVTSRLLRVSFATDRSSHAQAMSAPSPRATVPAVSPNCREGPLAAVVWLG